MAYLSGEPDLHLKHLTRERLHRQATDYEDDIEQAPLDQRARYVTGDVRNSYDLFHLFERRLARTEMTGIYEDIERPLMPLIASMEKYGVPVDVEALKQMRSEQAIIEDAIREWFSETYQFDVADDVQTRAWLTALLGHDPGTLDQRVISWYPNPEIDLLLFYRRTRTARRNFLDKSLKLWDAAGRPLEFSIYPSFNQAGGPDDEGLAPQSGRLSSSGEINIQQQPAGVKRLFVAPPGMKWWGFDYSGIELRTAAAVSGESTMIHALQNHIDMHDLLRDRTEAVSGTRPPRVVAKRWNFGKLYGAQLDKLIEILASIRIFISRETALAMDRATTELFPDYPKWGTNVVRKTARDGYAQTWYGRRRYLPDINSKDAKERAHAANAAINHVVQGTAADLIKKSMVRLAVVGRQYGAHLAYQVHDEIGGWVHEENAQAWARVAEAIMSSYRIIKAVPMIVEGGVGQRWSDVH
jgi:DNA polymerase-1